MKTVLHHIPTGEAETSMNESVVIRALGERGVNGQHSSYRISLDQPTGDSPAITRPGAFDINFQSGDPYEGVNGITEAALVAIAVDRLESREESERDTKQKKNPHVGAALKAGQAFIKALHDIKDNDDLLPRAREGRIERPPAELDAEKQRMKRGMPLVGRATANSAKAGEPADYKTSTGAETTRKQTAAKDTKPAK